MDKLFGDILQHMIEEKPQDPVQYIIDSIEFNVSYAKQVSVGGDQCIHHHVADAPPLTTLSNYHASTTYSGVQRQPLAPMNAVHSPCFTLIRPCTPQQHAACHAVHRTLRQGYRSTEG